MTTNILRRIQPINIPASWKRNVAPKIFFPTWDTPPTPDMLPRVQMVKLFQLYINEEYQRKVGEKGHGLIRSMATDWNWSIFHLPVVTPCEATDALEGLPTFEILDGQHTSIGALTNGSVREIPVLIVPAGTLKEKADNFVDLNTQRVAVSAPQIFWAKVAAGDECACLIKRAAEGAGAKIINKAPPYGDSPLVRSVRWLNCKSWPRPTARTASVACWKSVCAASWHPSVRFGSKPSTSCCSRTAALTISKAISVTNR